MIEIDMWMQTFLNELDKTFGKRIWFAGLQGSYARGEATESSDIDVVVILDNLSVLDIQRYNKMLDILPNRERICGFLSGKNDILNWEPADLFQFYFDTKPIRGNLTELFVLIDESAVERAIKTGVCNIFHGCVHNLLYEKSEEILRGLYKAASYTVQAILYKENKRYFSKYEDLCKFALPSERQIITTFWNLKNGGKIEFISMSEALFTWAQNRMNEFGKRK